VLRVRVIVCYRLGLLCVTGVMGWGYCVLWVRVIVCCGLDLLCVMG
jgi:hypothetical protein